MDSFFNSLGYGNFIIVLCVLIFVHELGHYAVAKLCNVRVEVFSIGFGKEIFGWYDKSGTRWKLSLIPLGGYVKMFGERSMPKNDANLQNSQDLANQNLSEDEIKYSFAHKSLSQRSAIVAAGPAANFIFAIVAFAAMFYFAGKPTPPDFMKSGIGRVIAGSAAADAGFMAGDVIIQIDNVNIFTFTDLVKAVSTSRGRELAFNISRNGLLKNIVVSPRKEKIQTNDDKMIEIYRLGVGAPMMQFNKLSFGNSISAAISETWEMSILTLESLWDMIIGKIGTENMGGPIKIAQISSDVGSMGGLAILSLMAILSINLGLLNLFPIPMLDGGHLLFYAFEAILRRPLNARVQEIFLRIGLMLLLSLMVFVTINDIITIAF